MKKQEFLDELKGYLLVLQDEEQEDILQEYEQHIEMKMESGLREDEVIRDFGSIRELAGEILEAYHVKLNDKETAEKAKENRIKKKLSANSLVLAVSSLKIHAVKSGKGLFRGICMCFFFLGKPFRLMGKRLNEWKEKVQKKRRMPVEKKEEKQVKRGMLFPAMARGIKSIYYGIISAICLIGRMIWNCGIVCASAFLAFMGLVFLYLFGMLFILWRQGYPLGGIVLGCLGAVLCFMSLAVFGSTFYRRKRRIYAVCGGRPVQVNGRISKSIKKAEKTAGKEQGETAE